jgi:hypothetical protein
MARYAALSMPALRPLPVRYAEHCSVPSPARQEVTVRRGGRSGSLTGGRTRQDSLPVAKPAAVSGVPGAAYWRSVSDLLSSGEFPPIWQCFHNLSIQQNQCHKRLPPCSHPDRPIPPPAQRLRDPCLCESEATSKYLIEIAL